MQARAAVATETLEAWQTPKRRVEVQERQVQMERTEKPTPRAPSGPC